MAISKADLINRSLTLVGAEPIVNITDDSEQARVVNRVYEIALRSILAECKWNFATKRKLLTLSTDTLDWYYSNESYVYIKPTDMIRIFGTNDDSNNAVWRVEGDYIISDTSGLGILYTYYLDSPSKYPSFFIEAFSDKLCSEIAYRIVNNRTLGEQYKKLLESVSLPKASASDAQTGVQQFIKDDAWENAKYSDRVLNT